MLQNLGFLINFEKLQLCPEIEFLGNSCGLQRYDTHSSTGESKYNNRSVLVLSHKRSIDSAGSCSTDWKSKLFCSSSSASPMFILGNIHILGFSIQKKFERKVCLSQVAKKEFIWWVNSLKLSNGRSLLNSKPKITIAIKSSMKCCRTYCHGQRTGTNSQNWKQKNI